MRAGGFYLLRSRTHTRTKKSYKEQAMKIGVLTGGGDCPGLTSPSIMPVSTAKPPIGV